MKNHYPRHARNLVQAYISKECREVVLKFHRNLGITRDDSNKAFEFIRKEEKTTFCLWSFHRLVNYKEETSEERVYKFAFYKFIVWYVQRVYLIKFALT
jgi:hypothetical protein